MSTASERNEYVTDCAEHDRCEVTVWTEWGTREPDEECRLTFSGGRIAAEHSLAAAARMYPDDPPEILCKRERRRHVIEPDFDDEFEDVPLTDTPGGTDG
jgi:hypothetical protein